MDPLLSRALASGSPGDLLAVSQEWASGLHTHDVEPAGGRRPVERRWRSTLQGLA